MQFNFLTYSFQNVFFECVLKKFQTSQIFSIDLQKCCQFLKNQKSLFKHIKLF